MSRFPLRSSLLRLATAAVGVPLVLAAIFKLPAIAFFILLAVVIDWAAAEFVALVRPLAPHAPWRLLLVLVPVAGFVLSRAVTPPLPQAAGFWLLAAGAALSVGLGSAVLFTGTPVSEALPGLGVLAFAVPYFAVPIASLSRLQQHDPWVLFLLVAIVWLGDTAAYYVGTAWGRRKLAPVVSPHKTWEGAIASFVVSLVATAVWSRWQLGGVDPRVLAIGAVTSVASQVGDLVESLVKRGARVKDSGGVLPGHGGIFDRVDALLFAAPVLLLGWWLCGFEGNG